MADCYQIFEALKNGDRKRSFEVPVGPTPCHVNRVPNPGTFAGRMARLRFELHTGATWEEAVERSGVTEHEAKRFWAREGRV